MTDARPGVHPERLLRLMRGAVARCRLDLRGAVVLTEAATGAYAVTPVLAAMAGADRVIAVTHTSRFGTEAQVAEETGRLARLAGVGDRIEVVTAITGELIGSADVVTNSGHVRPIDAEKIARMKPSAVVSLMYEAWEFREADVDLAACRARGIRLGATNERHPAVGVFDFLGVMAVKLLHDAGVAVQGDDLCVVCDNPFADYLTGPLRACGAEVVGVARHDQAPRGRGFDAMLLATTPGRGAGLSAADAEVIAARWPGMPVVQFWGDLDRPAFRRAGVPVWPVASPGEGHMGVLPSEVGPEPVVRLQAGGLKVGEVLWRGPAASRADLAIVQPLGARPAEAVFA